MKSLLTVGVAAVALTVLAKETKIPSPDEVGNEAAVIALTNALKNAAENDVLTLGKGVYDLTGIESHSGGTDSSKPYYGPSHLYSPKKITFQGDSSLTREEIVLKGDGTKRILLINPAKATVRNLTFTNGNASVAYGGAVLGMTDGGGMGSFMTLTNCWFVGNKAKYSGVTHGATMRCCLCAFNHATSQCGVLGYGLAYDSTFLTNSSAGTDGVFRQTNGTRCLFEGNRTTGGAGGVSSYSGSYSGCTFIGNVASNANANGTSPGGCCSGASTITNCTFIGNEGGNNGGVLYDQKGSVYDSCFVDNWVRSGGSQGVIIGNSSSNIKVIRCAFTNNAAGWSAGVGTTVSVWSNCTFVGNSLRATNGSVAGISGGTAYGCVFRDHWSTSDANRKHPSIPVSRVMRFAPSLSASGVTMYDCDIQGVVQGCKMTRCTIWGVSNNCAVVGSGCYLTNCVVRANKIVAISGVSGSPYGILYNSSASRDPVLVNCTVVDNVGSMFYTTNAVAVNSLFYGNYAADGTTHRDISAQNSKGVTLTNCLYQYKSTSANTQSIVDVSPVVLAANETPKFNEGQNPAYPYYMPRHSSRAVGAGSGDVAWTADLGGYPRHADGSVDIGAYQCWIPAPGLLLLVR